MKPWVKYLRSFLLCCSFFLITGFLLNLDMGNALDLQKGEMVMPQPKIPEQAIRLRILAHSDSVQDQWLKRKVRDAIIQEIGKWKQKPQTIEEARLLVKSQLPRLNQVAESTVRHLGFTYPVKVDYGSVPFPTKLYGEIVYPAGHYEAVRVTIGDGNGENWWCVLFPPLCFVNMENGDAVEKNTQAEASIMRGAAKAFASEQEERKIEEVEDGVSVRFYLLEKVEEWWSKQNNPEKDLKEN